MNQDLPPDEHPDAGRPPLSTAAVSPPPPPPPGYLPPAYPAPQPSKGVVNKVVTSLVATLFILSILLNVYLLIFVSSLVTKSEDVYRDGAGEKRVVIVPVDGGIDNEMADYVRRAFKSLEEDPPAAIVLRVNSGGGGVTPSDQIWHTISSYKADHPDVKIVGSFGGVAASGGYYIATPCDYIFCETTGITGSIGVMAQIPSVEAMVQKLGVEMNVVVADGSERKAVANNLFENWTNDDGQLTEAGEENQEVLKNLLNSAWERFVEVVDEGRPTLSTEQVEALATGDIYTAAEARDNELVNEVGYLDDAVDKAIEMAGLTDADPKVTVIRQGGGGILGLLGANRTGPSLSELSPDRVRTWLEDFGEVRLAYRVSFD